MKVINFILLSLTLTFSFNFSLFAQQSDQAQTQQPATEPKKDEQSSEAPSEQSPKTNAGDNASTSFNRSDIKIEAPIARDSQLTSDLKHYFGHDQVKPLLAGTEEFITLERPSETANSKGIVIFIPDWQQTPTSPKAINYLRHQLPKQGWMTISLQSANMPANYPSRALKPAERHEQNSKALADYQTQLKAKLTALMEKTQSLPGLVFVVVAGNHAGLVFDLYQSEQIPLPSAVLVLSGYALSDSHNALLAKHLAESDIPVLDLFLTKDNKQMIAAAKSRKIFAEKTMKVFYRQRQLQNFTTGYYPPSSLLSAINGWFKAIGW